MTSGGIGKNELSMNDINPKKGLENLWLANSIDLSYNFFNTERHYIKFYERSNRY